MPQPRKLHDRYFKQAKAEGYVARSAFKLLEIQEKRGLIRHGHRVLDLGCAPGSWLQVTQEIVGEDGQVVGLDLTEVRLPLAAHVLTLVQDVYKIDPAELFKQAGARGREPRFDVILSDMAPNTSGHGDDHLSARLCERVLDLCGPLLRPGGNVLMKILEGEPTPPVIARTKRLFVEAGTTKPAASREISKEIFIWGMNYRGEPKGAAPPAPPAKPRGWGTS